MKTLDETNDCMVVSNISTTTATRNNPIDEDSSPAIESEGTSLDGNERERNSQTKNHSPEDKIPVSEIILSAHVCLLIHAILYIKPEVPVGANDGDIETRSDRITVSTHRDKSELEAESNRQREIRRNGTYSDTKNEFIRYLPKKSLWLPIRILKAFLYLEEKTGCLLLENMSPVLDVIHVMTRLEDEI